ncbi:MAG: hypothetical protein ACK502_05340 [Alphaproteobacteria bacterium]
MKLSQAEQDQLTSLLTRLYQELCEIETQHELLAGEGDFRPRIDYFHDAIRAFFLHDAAALEDGGRLNVENLAYDLSCLRYLQEKPLSSFKPQGQSHSPKTDLVEISQLPTAKQPRPDRATRERISELYQHYAVLFAALLKPVADKDFLQRTDELNHDVKEINNVISQIQGNKGMAAINEAVQHVEDPQLRGELMAFIQHGGLKQKEQINKLIQYLKNQKTKRDTAIKHIDKAHMQYATTQLAVYEESKDLIKNLASKGMNLVGKFVESSISQTRREMGR